MSDVLGSGPGCPREIGRVLKAAQEGGLMAHCVEDATGQPPIVSCFREAKGLDEVPLGEAVQAAVVGHPRRQQGGLRGCGEQFGTNAIAVAPVQQALEVVGQVLD
jgi:hypothetical protein